MKKRVNSILTLILLVSLCACGGEDEETAMPAPVIPVVSTEGLNSPPPSWPPEEGKNTFVVSMLGDCTLSSSQYNNDYEKVLNGDYTWPFSGMIEYLAGDDFTLANLECAFSEKQLTGYTTFFFCGPPEHAEILVEGSVECVTMGNNHTEDFGQPGIDSTHEALDAVQMPYIDEDACQVFDVEGMKLGVYVTHYMPTVEAVEAGIAELQELEPDIIIVSAHWGNEGEYQPTDEQVEVAHAAIDAGADIVYGSHPHVLQPTEKYGDGFICYSLGNFSFGGNTAPRDRDTAIAQATITLNRDGNYAVEKVECIPCCLSSTEKLNDYRPVPYEEGTEEYERTVSKLNGTFEGSDLSIDYSNL